MQQIVWKTFIHPHEAYRLEFPAHWENRVEKEGADCGFGPWDRDNVGLWISILPMSIDTDVLVEDLARLFQESVSRTQAANVRRDESLRHHALKADITAEDNGGHYWMIAGGDLVLLASSQVPVEERDTWNPLFDRLMASLHITRDEELQMRKIAGEVMRRLRKAHPEQDYRFEEKGIRGRDHMVFLENLYREVAAAPERQDETIQRFVDALNPSMRAEMGHETWDEVLDCVLPVLKPHDYIKSDGPTQHITTTDWLADVLICYAIKGNKTLRFLTDWDLRRWEIDKEGLHRRAIENLVRLDWPRRLEGSRQPGGGRMILVVTSDSFGASRLLHPDLHRLFSGPLGNPFLAGIPDRDTLVTFSNNRSLKKRLSKQIKKDHDTSAYPITDRLFLVTADGIAPATMR